MYRYGPSLGEKIKAHAAIFRKSCIAMLLPPPSRAVRADPAYAAYRAEVRLLVVCMLADMYAPPPEDGYKQRLTPTYDLFASKVKELDSPSAFAWVDARLNLAALHLYCMALNSDEFVRAPNGPEKRRLSREMTELLQSGMELVRSIEPVVALLPGEMATPEEAEATRTFQANVEASQQRRLARTGA